MESTHMWRREDANSINFCFVHLLGWTVIQRKPQQHLSEFVIIIHKCSHSSNPRQANHVQYVAMKSDEAPKKKKKKLNKVEHMI